MGCLGLSAGAGQAEAAGSRVRQLRGQSQRRRGGERRTPSGRDRARGGWGGGPARARHGRGGAPGACPLEARRDWAWPHTRRVTYISPSPCSGCGSQALQTVPGMGRLAGSAERRPRLPRVSVACTTETVSPDPERNKWAQGHRLPTPLPLPSFFCLLRQCNCHAGPDSAWEAHLSCLSLNKRAHLRVPRLFPCSCLSVPLLPPPPGVGMGLHYTRTEPELSWRGKPARKFRNHADQA